MRVVIQRVKRASITIEGDKAKQMGQGLVVLFAASKQDELDASPELIEKLAMKIANLRIFSDSDGRMNLAASTLNLSLMVVSQFTLLADTKKGNRPSFIEAAEAESAKSIYNHFVEALNNYGWTEFLTGKFGAHMDIELVNDGPVTIIIDTKEWENHS